MSVQPPLERTTHCLVTLRPSTLAVFSLVSLPHFQSFSRTHPSFPLSNPLTSSAGRSASHLSWGILSSRPAFESLFPSTQQQSSLCGAQTVPRCRSTESSSPCAYNGNAPYEVLQVGLSALSASLLALFRLCPSPSLPSHSTWPSAFCPWAPLVWTTLPTPALSSHGWVSTLLLASA